MSERRQNLPWKVFAAIMEEALGPQAQEKKHPGAFYKGWRLVAIDGTQFSVSNTPQILGCLSKAASRRMKAAFAKVGAAVLVELGIHNPLAAEIGRKMGRVKWCWPKGFLIGCRRARFCSPIDSLYGVGVFLMMLIAHFQEVPGAFLVRIRSNLKASADPDPG